MESTDTRSADPKSAGDGDLLDGALLTDLLTRAAGAPGEAGPDFLDAPFEDLGYDSLALLETAALIQARWGIALPDHVVVEARTPRELIRLANEALRGR